MDEEEMLFTNNETENTDTQSAEEFVDGNVDANVTTEETVETEKTTKKTLKDILSENPELQKEFNTKIQNRLRLKEKAVRREYESQSREVEELKNLKSILQQGTEEEDVEKISNNFRDFYEKRGKKIDVPTNKKSNLSEEEEGILADYHAKEIIDCGVEEMKDELDRLDNIGFENMSSKDKKVYQKIYDAFKFEQSKNELESIGVKADILGDQDFKDFSKKFEGSKFTAKEIYDLFNKQSVNNVTEPKPNVEQIGDVAGNTSKVDRDYFTAEELDRLTREDFEKPGVFEKATRSYEKFRKK